VGGILGVGFGVGGATALSTFSQFDITVTLSSVFLAFGFALAVGIFFGLHPAYSASRLKPIDALRHE
jgi:putative ABC transport system permease protein